MRDATKSCCITASTGSALLNASPPACSRTQLTSLHPREKNDTTKPDCKRTMIRKRHVYKHDIKYERYDFPPISFMCRRDVCILYAFTSTLTMQVEKKLHLHFTIRSVEFKTMSALDIFMGSGCLQANVFLLPRRRSALFSACFRGGEMRLVQWHHSDASPPCLTAGAGKMLLPREGGGCCWDSDCREGEDGADGVGAVERKRRERERSTREILSARCTTPTWRRGELPRTRAKGLRDDAAIRWRWRAFPRTPCLIDSWYATQVCLLLHSANII